MKKIITKQSREIINNTVDEFEELVCSTMGPFGQCIALHNDVGAPVITKDGVSVAKVIEFEEPEKQLIAEILRQAAEKTNNEAGDGTTTSTAIAAATVRSGTMALASGEDVNSLRRGISSALKEVERKLEKMKITFDELPLEGRIEVLRKIAMISTNGDEQISGLISEAVAKAGRSGIVNIQKGTTYEIIQSEGMRVPYAGFTDFEFVRGTPDKKATLHKCRILITTHELESSQVIKILEPKILQAIMNNGESLLVMAKKSGKGFLANMINNNAKGSLKNVCVKAPYFGAVGREMMDDVAAMTGAQVIDEKEGHKLSNVEISHLGYAETIEVSSDATVVFNPRRDEARIAQRVKILEEKAKAIGFKEGDADKTMERLAALTGSVYNVLLPSLSDIEDKEVRDRVEDAINACRGALEYGYLPGGGVALLRIAHEISSTSPYCKILADIISYPFRKILGNAGEAYQVVEDVLRKSEGNYVYDARYRKYGEALELGVIDSYKVISKSLTNGISVGLMLLTTVGIIANKPEQSSPFSWDPSMV